jgi:WD40 repeat protein
MLLVVTAVAQDQSAGNGDSQSKWITSIARLGSADQFVAATADGLLLREASVYSFHGATPNQLTELYKHPAAVWQVDASGDGAKVASVDYSGNLTIFDVATAQATLHEKAMERWCPALLFSPDDKLLVGGNEAGKVLVWDLASGQLAKSLELDGHAVWDLAFAPDGSQLAAADGGGHIHLMSWPGLEQTGKIDVSQETAWCVAYIDEGKNLLVGSGDRQLYRCEAKPDAKPESMAKGTDWITQLAVSPSGQVAAAEVGGKLHFPSTGGTDSMDATSGVWSLCWNGDAQLFAGTRKDGIVIAGRSWRWTEPVPPAAKPEEKPAEEPKPADEAKPAEEPKPEGEAKPAEEAKPADTPPPAVSNEKQDE